MQALGLRSDAPDVHYGLATVCFLLQDFTSAVFTGSKLEPGRAPVAGVCKGESVTVLAEELTLSRQCVYRWRKRIQQNAYARLSDAPLSDAETETDEMFQNAGEKRRKARRS